MEYEDIVKEIEKARNSIYESKLPDEEKQKIFDKITDEIIKNISNKSERRKSKKIKRKSNRKIVNKKSYEDSTEIIESEKNEIINSISRSENEIIYKIDKTLDQALYIIKISEKEKNIRGLTPSQISDILKEVFKINKSRPAISMALMEAVTYTDRNKTIVRGSPAYKYVIMHKGEEYLNKKIEGLENKEENSEN